MEDDKSNNEACLCYLLLLHCDAGVAPSAGPKRRLLLNMRGTTTDAGGCCFRRRGKVRRVPSIVIAAGLCLLSVARAVDGVVMVRELQREGKKG
ncbi:hypothetical protein Peur_058127 [Populus x canadensis]